MANQDRMPGARFMTGTAGLAALGVLVGLLLGVGGYTFFYAEGLSYLSTDPKACVNCHLPHDFIGKYVAKAENGWHHSKGFTLQDFHEPIMIKAKNARILQQNCLACHADLVHELVGGVNGDPDEVQCVHCHSGVGHGETTGLGGPERADEIEGNAS
jgi:cytochrome c nitrite reductase small subunit